MNRRTVTRVGVVTGMMAEARCLPRHGSGSSHIVLCSGGDAGQAAECARRLLAEGAEGLLSFGLAGGLDPTLRPGAVIFAEHVIGPDGDHWPVDSTWRDAILAVSGADALVTGDVVGSDKPLRSVSEKANLFAKTDARAVDMESHAVAREADELGAPFVVLRVVADAATRALPRSALAGLGPDGRLRPGAVLGQLALRPWELAALLALACDTNLALRALRRAAATSAVPLFGGGLV